MAGRRGRFGRRPSRGGGNLAALIASLIREQRAAEDKAIFDAYNNGGLFQGKPVDDARLLAHIQARRDGFSQDDPLWDQWNNTLIQQRFTIGEQKIALRYKQGKASAADVAAFYKGQLASIPKDSAFYREVAGRAAEWAKAARQASGGGRGGGSGKAARDEAAAAGNALQDARANSLLVDFAIRAALEREGYNLGENQPVTAVGADVIERLFTEGKIVGPGGVMTLDSYKASAAATDKAYARTIAAYKAIGQNYVSLIDDRHDFQEETLNQISSIPYVTRAEAVYSTLNDELQAANGNPEAIAKAYAKAAGKIAALHHEAQTAGADTDLLAQLDNDRKALAGETPNGPGLLDTIIAANVQAGQAPWQAFAPDDGVASSAAQIALDAKATLEGQKLVASGRGYLVQDTPGGAIQVVDSRSQPEAGLPNNYQATVVMIDGVPTKVYLAGTPVVASASKDANGNAVAASPRNTPQETQAGGFLGYEFTYTLDGEQQQAWAVWTGKGLVFTKDNPFLGTTTKTKDGTILVSQPDLDGQPLDVTSYISPSAMAKATTNLVIDEQAQQALFTNPDRAYQLYVAGKIDAQTLVENLTPRTPNLSPEEAWAAVQKAKADSAEALRNQRASERNERYADPQQQATATATAILSNLTNTNLVSPKGTGYVNPLMPWQQVFTPEQTQQALINHRAGEREPLNIPVPLGPPAPAPEPLGPPAPTSTPLSLPSYAYPKSPTVSAPIKTPTTTTISSGRYTGKTIPL